MVIGVSDTLEFKATRSKHEIFHNEFTSKEITQVFVNHLDKHISERSRSIGVNIWGVSLENIRCHSEEAPATCKEENYVSSVHYQRIPAETVHITPDNISLKPEVIAALQHVEKSLKQANYEAKDHFKHFFEIYGTHINHGSIEFGGTLVSIAYCEGFREEERPKLADAVKEASEAAVLLGANKKVRPDVPFNAYEVLGKSLAIPEEILQNITITVRKLGGPQKQTERDEWKRGLVENQSLWEVINRTSPPKPMWKMLLCHKDDFDNYLGLINAMQEEWKINVCGHVENKKPAEVEQGEEEKNTAEAKVKSEGKQIEDTTKKEEEKQKNALRQDIQLWIDRFKNLNQQNIDSGIKNLASLRKKYDRISKDWQDEVIYLRDVQTRLVWTARYMMNLADQNQRLQLTAALNHILRPLELIQTEHFPNIRQIIESVKEAEGITDCHPFMMDNIRQLPDILRENMVQIGLQDHNKDLSQKNLQMRLESTMKALSRSPIKLYEGLLFLGVLKLFGLSLDGFLFDHLLVKEEMESMIQQLEFHIQVIDAAPNKMKQAYILGVGLCCMKEKEAVMQYMIDGMPGGICRELKEAHQKIHGFDNTLAPDKLQATVDKMLQDNQLKLDLKPLVHSLKDQLMLHLSEKTRRQESEIQDDSVDRNVDKLLEALDMKRFYPQKLAYEDIIMMGPDVHDDVNKKPATLQELPWYFMKHIIGLDSDTRENCHILNYLNDESGDEGEAGDNIDEDLNAIHPLDLIFVIFACADDFLRQELIEKMARCQYAVPCILPSTKHTKHGSKNLILHWALKGMTRTFSSCGSIINRALVDTEAPLIACMNIGEETSWKSKLLNKMLSPQQETFWHQGLKGGNCEQRVSQGMAEAAWYLPGRHGDNKFPYPVTFVNVRQDAVQSGALCDRLYSSSTLTCLFVEEVTSELKAFLKRMPTLENLLLVILHRKEFENRMKDETKQLQLEFNLKKHQVIRKAAQDANFDMVYEQLRKSVEQMVTLVAHSGSLSTFVMHAKEVDGIEVDDKKCYVGQMAAESILRDIDEYNMWMPGGAKAKILSYQSDLASRQEVAALDKELYRQRKLGENMTVQKYWFDIKEKKWQLQLNQLLKPMSESFKYFLQSLLALDTTDRKYFLQSLKLGLNERSIQQLQPLYEEYEKCRIEDDSKERNEKLKKIDEQLTHGSLGIEHFFREMAITYENTIALRERIGSYELDGILDILADAMAAVLMNGTAIEIMDGDAVNVPVAWLKAVLSKIENSSESTLFKVAVLGAQSCGKSTLLNTIFGLNFPVSSGRCTRGAYMQLVKVDETLKKTLNCDYVAVIDSEGLMSRTKVDGTDYDNELSTFIIGLSDLTLVIIKGEGNEMHDVLPLAIHVFLRMNIVGEHQACHFIHQNMGAVDVMTKVATEIDAFVRDLNEKTLAAAKDVDQSDQYRKFTDVLHYDPVTDNTYVPGLWDGTLPMGKTNAHYSKIMAKLKSDIAKNITDMQQKHQKGLCTFNDFTKRLDELWDAIKYENFVLSFKNVLAVEAHRKLTKVFDEEQWDLKREVRDMIQREEHVIENEIKGGNSTRTVKQLSEASLVELINCLTSKIADIEERIMHYFQCAGCKDCNATITNRHLLANNEKEFGDDVRSLKRTLIREVETSMEKLEIKMKTDKRIYELSTDMDDILKRKVQEAIRTRKAKNLTEEDTEEIFKDLWTEAAGDILRNAKHAEKDENIEATVQATIRSLFGSDDHLYLQMQTGKNSTKYHKANGTLPTFTVEGARHIKLIGRLDRLRSLVFRGVNEQDEHRLQIESDRIINDTSKHYDSKSAPPEGRQFNQKDVELLFKDVLEEIGAFKDERFKTTNDYKVDLVHHIETLAVTGFTEMHETYCNNSSPLALLEQKKKSYHDLFVIKMGQGDAAAKFCETVLQDIVLQNVEEQLSCTELLHDLRVHCGEMFRDIKGIQASIMVDLLEKNKFVGYEQYIATYKSYVKHKMSAESTRHFSDADRFRVLATTKLDEIISKIQGAIDKTVESLCTGNDFMKTFFSKIENLKILHNEASAYMELDVPDKNQFGEIIHQQLQERVRESIIKTIDSWKVKVKLEEKGLDDFIFKEVVGCTATCPFCKVPCDAHSGGKSQGNHSATLHRPEGLGGVRYEDTECLVSEDCCSAVASDEKFRSHETSYQWQPYKEYHKWFPNWTIHGNANPDVEKYWKWVFAEYNADFAHHYSANPAEVLLIWHQYRKGEIIKDIEDNYHVKIDY